MKRAYSEYVYRKNLNNEAALSFEEVVEWTWNDPEFCRVDSLDRSSLDDLRLVEMYARFKFNSIGSEVLAKAGCCLHLFFTGDGMHDWLKSCAAPFTHEHFNVLSTLQVEPYVHNTINAGYTTHSRVAMFHFAGGNSPCYLLAMLNREDTPGRYNGIIGEGRGMSLCFNENMDFADTVSEETNTVIGTVAAAISYMKCFPDTVISGVPFDAKHPAHFRKFIAKSVGMHKSLVERGGPSPHYRTGHFRYLESERFKKARFTTVFVHGTFVKGKSKVVLSPEDSEKDVVILEGT